MDKIADVEEVDWGFCGFTLFFFFFLASNRISLYCGYSSLNIQFSNKTNASLVTCALLGLFSVFSPSELSPLLFFSLALSISTSTSTQSSDSNSSTESNSATKQEDDKPSSVEVENKEKDEKAKEKEEKEKNPYKGMSNEKLAIARALLGISQTVLAARLTVAEEKYKAYMTALVQLNRNGKATNTEDAKVEKK